MRVVSQDAFYMDRMRHAGHAYHRQKVPDENISAAGYRRVEDPKVARDYPVGFAYPQNRRPKTPDAVSVGEHLARAAHRPRGFFF